MSNALHKSSFCAFVLGNASPITIIKCNDLLIHCFSVCSLLVLLVPII